MITVPKLTSRWSWPIALLVFLVVGAVGVYVFATDPGNRAAAIVGVLVLWAGFALMLAQRTSFDPQEGRLQTKRAGVFGRTIDLREATKVAIGGNGVNGVMLGVRSRTVPVYVALVQISGTIKRSQDADLLTRLADAVEAFVPAPARGQVVEQLRAQAAHMAAGGGAADSPLAPLASGTLGKAGGAAGGAATIFTMLQ